MEEVVVFCVVVFLTVANVCLLKKESLERRKPKDELFLLIEYQGVL